MKKYANTKKEISCIIAHLFQTLELPCKKCKQNINNIIITGTTYKGNKATMVIEDNGIYYIEGAEEEINEIRSGNCLYGNEF